MAITDITITQDNIVNGSNLLPIHSSLSFIADVTYTGTTPDVLHVEILTSADVLIDTWKAIPYRDLLPTVRSFVFIANDPIKSIMDDFDDTFQLGSTLEHIEEITKILKVKFVDPDTPATNDVVEISFIHGASQFGSNPNLDAIFNNEEDIYYSSENGFVYVYFYNDDITNVVDVNVTIEDFALDFDGSIFTDYNDRNFTIYTP